MKSQKMITMLVATLIVVLTIAVSASAQGRLPNPTIIAPPVIQELSPYLSQYQSLRIGNASNPYEWVGQYHNAAMDYIGKGVSSPASAARIIGPIGGGTGPTWPGPTIPCWPWGDVVFRLNASLFKPYAPDAAEAIDQRRSLFSADSSGTNARWKIMQDMQTKFTDREQAEFDEFNFQLQGLAMALGSGRMSHDDFQRRIVEVENVVTGQRGPSENVRMRILLMTTVARHSAYWNIQAAPAAARHSCPTCVQSDMGGASTGAAIGGIWGAVIGAVAASAIDYFTQPAPAN